MPPPPVPPPPGYGSPTGYLPYGAPMTSYAGFGARLGAWFLDALIVGVPTAIVFVIVLSTAFSGCSTTTNSFGRTTLDCGSGEAATIGLFYLLAFVVGLVVAFFYFVRPIAAGRQTVGMKVAHIRIVDADTGGPIGMGRSIGRYLMQQFISGSICWLGYLWMLWDDRNQTWHDKVASSIVVTA
jgi:uncharacterized RDD family membrane protein YckC